MKTSFIPIDYDYFDWQGKNHARIIGRDEKGKRICIVDTCDIYLWAILEDGIPDSKIKKLIEKIQKIKLNIKGRQTKVEKVELHNKKFLTKPVKALKIFATNYKDLHDIASELKLGGIEKRRGYDLGFITHYIIEKKINPLCWYEIQGEVLDNTDEFGGIGKGLDVDLCLHLTNCRELKGGHLKFTPKTLAYDIECDEFKIGEGEILMVSLVGKNYKKVITWKGNQKNCATLDRGKEKSRRSKIRGSSKETNGCLSYVIQVKDEAELLEKFIEEVRNYSPDFLVGYFSDGFDMPYLKARAEKHNIKLSLGLDDSQPRFSRGMQLTAKTKGIVHIDLLKFIRTAYAQYMKSETLSLNEVANEFLGDTKKDFKIKHSSNLGEKDWTDYIEYNLHDSVLTLGLFEKFWPDMLEFTKTAQEPVFEVSRFGLSKHVESYILHNLEKFNEIPEKRPTHEEISQRRRRPPSEGAFVYEPKPGLYKDIAMFDFTSMHTSIIISFNISKSTLLEKKEKNSYASPEIDFKGKKKIFYFSKKPGFLPQMLEEIMEKRKKFKAQFKKNPNPITKARSNAFKVLSASVHGYIAFFGARYFSEESSNSILAFVRKMNKEAIEKTKKAGFKVVYADTDSIAFSRGNSTESQTLKFLDKLNKELPGVMELELDGFFKRGLWVSTRAGTTGAKKKYALIDKKNKLKIRGFETVRRDWCQLARKVQNNIIKLILEQGGPGDAVEYIKEIVKKIKSREVPKEQLIIKTMLKKPLSEYKATTPHVVAAKKMQLGGLPIDQGGMIQYFIAETRDKKKLVRDKVKLPDEKGEYNIEYYLNNQILPAVENILQVFNVNTKELIDGKKQMTLGDF